MATPSSPTDSNPPSAVPLPITLPPPPSSRRLPPPCWTPDETAALIDAYRDKWYALGRGNLKANHWQEVAESVANSCPAAATPKTAVQCRHKMEKLRKRYRTEIQRARSLPVARFNSSWVHFKSMDFMEKGPEPPKPDPTENLDDNDEHDEDQELYEEFKNGSGSHTVRSLNKLYTMNGVGGGSSSSGFRIRIPSGVSIAQHGSKLFGKVGDPKFGSPTNSGSASRGAVNGGGSYNNTARFVKEKRSGLGKRERERESVGEMVGAIRVLRDGFVRMEQMKMEMAREIESMRMEMEMKRTEMILESQQRIVEAFAKAISEKRKKSKRMASPNSSEH